MKNPNPNWKSAKPIGYKWDAKPAHIPGETIKQKVARLVESDPITIEDRKTAFKKWGIRV